MDIESLYREFALSEGICTDTRKDLKDRIFFALSGDNFDGNRFVETALEGGCRLAVCELKEFEGHERVLCVPSAVECLQNLATHHRRQSSAQLLAITGSNGKTTTKELLKRVLGMKYSILATEGNLNNHLGVPLTILRLKEEDVAVIEMGANHPGEIALLAKVAEPDLGIIINVGKAHLEGFGSLDGVLNAKGELYEYLAGHGGIAILDGEDDVLRGKAEKTGVSFLRVGDGGDLAVSVELVSQNPFLEVNLKIGDNNYRTRTSLVGAYNLQNIKLAAACGLHFGVDGTAIAEALASYVPGNQRSQLVRGKANSLVFDSYNANPSSMREAVDGLTAYADAKTMVILGDMAELGPVAEQEHRELAEWLRKRGLDRIVLVGPVFGSLLEPSGNRLVFKDVKEVESWLKAESPEGYTILIKGSRSMKMERLSPVLGCGI